MAFEYTPYRNPYIGTIADLMARGEDAKAKALIDVASAQARAAQAKGQIYGNAISSIGQGIAQSITDYNSPEAKQQREMDRAQDILKTRGLETIQEKNQRVNGGNLQPGSPYEVFTDAPSKGLPDRSFSGIDFSGNLGPSVRTDATFRMVDGEPVELPAESFNGLPSAMSRSNLFGGQPETAPSDGLSRSMAGMLGQTETRTSLPTGRKPSVESYTTTRSRYTDDRGMYNVELAQQDLLASGISPTIAAKTIKQLQDGNNVFADYDKRKKEFEQEDIKVRGTIANAALNAYQMNPAMGIDAAIELAIGPATGRLKQEELEQFQVAIFGKSDQEKTQMLQSLVKQWDDQNPLRVLGRGDVAQGISGTTRGEGAPLPQPKTTFGDVEIEGYRKHLAEGGTLSIGAYRAREAAPAPGAASIQEYKFAVSQGYTGSFEQWSIDDANRRRPSGADQSETIGLRNDLLRQDIRKNDLEAEALQKTKDLSKRAAEQAAQGTVDTISNLVTIDPKTGNVTGLAPGTSGLFGLRVPFLSSVGGTKTATADAYLKQLTAERIVELIGEMKSQSKTGATGFGQLNIEELRVLQQASTVLSQRNISDATALKEITKIYNIARKYNQSVAPAPNKSSGIITDTKDPNFGQPKP